MPSLKPFILILSTLAVTHSAIADECNDKTSTPEIVECMERQTTSWEAVVEFDLSNSLRLNPKSAKATKQAQEAWLQYRQASCKAVGMGEGTIAAVEAAECRLRMTKARAAELEGENASSETGQPAPGPIPPEAEDENSGSQRDDPPDGASPIPAQRIRDVYALLVADKLDNERNPIMNQALASSFFARPFLDLWAKDQTCWEGDGTEGNAQMWVGGQDYKISDVRVTVPMATADTERVVASVTSFGTEQHWAYEFRHTGGEWLVHDVLLEGHSLSDAMRNGCRK